MICVLNVSLSSKIAIYHFINISIARTQMTCGNFFNELEEKPVEKISVATCNFSNSKVETRERVLGRYNHVKIYSLYSIVKHCEVKCFYFVLFLTAFQ